MNPNSAYSRLNNLMSRPRLGDHPLGRRLGTTAIAGAMLLSLSTAWQFGWFGLADGAYAQTPTASADAQATETILPLVSTAPGNVSASESSDPFSVPALPSVEPTIERAPRPFHRSAPAPGAPGAHFATPVQSPTQRPHWAEAAEPVNRVHTAGHDVSHAPRTVQGIPQSAATQATPIQQVQQTTQSLDLFAEPSVETAPNPSAGTPAQAEPTPAGDPIFAPPVVNSAPQTQLTIDPEPQQLLIPSATASGAAPPLPTLNNPPAPVQVSDPFGSAPVLTEPAPTSAELPSATSPVFEPTPTPTTPTPGAFPQQFTEDPYLNSRSEPLAPLPRPTFASPETTSTTATGVNLSEPPLAEEQLYEVQSGDNYWTISRHFYGSARYFAALAEYNRHRIPDPQKMRPGMIVLGPDASLLHQKYPKLTGPDPKHPVVEPPSGFFVDQHGQPAFRVGKGDTLSTIAQTHLGRVSRWIQIYQLNKQVITDPNNLKLGTILRLPPDACQVQVVSEVR
ncbi:MAG: LysM peptidoglycan-binding domain-containing protein [Planctomycetaceae bacterium]|nr:LysM peptidoglycan-binding domain-containing protein [Planctomycetaceae bacterium]